MSKKLMLLVAICFMAMTVTAYGAPEDKLIVQNSSEVTQFVVTDTGKMGIGTATPAYAGQISKTDNTAVFAVTRVGGANNFISAGPGAGNFGTTTNHPLRLFVNLASKMQLNNDNSISWTNGASISAGGTVNSSSSREYKKNISELNSAKAIETLKGLTPVTFNYKVNNESHVGFIAEDVPEMVASKDRKGLSALDIVAVLTKVVQDKTQVIDNQQKLINAMAAKLETLEEKVNRLETKGMRAQK